MSTDDITIIKPRPGKRSPVVSKPDSADQTIIKPRPRASRATAPPPQDDATIIKSRGQGGNRPVTSAINIPNESSVPPKDLVQAARPILALAPQLKQINGQIDSSQLHTKICSLINEFTHLAGKIEPDLEIRNNAQYVLCALIDETILNTPWGETCGWSQNPILSTFHKETYGGERFYQILEECLSQPHDNLQLIEIIFVALSLGFMGKFRIDPQGPIKIEKLRSRLYEVLTRSRDKYNKELSVHITPATGRKRNLQTLTPVWVILALLTLGAFSIYTYFLMGLNAASDNTRTHLAQLIPTPEKQALDISMVRPEFIELRALLTPEINQGVLSVADYATHTSITLHDQELFASGSNTIIPAFEPILDKIGKALESIPGKIVVSGHTDNQVIRTARYPSNWHLSLARASEIVKYLALNAELTSRLLPEGRGSNEPITTNATPEGRAQNRRVVLDVYYTINTTTQSANTTLSPTPLQQDAKP